MLRECNRARVWSNLGSVNMLEREAVRQRREMEEEKEGSVERERRRVGRERGRGGERARGEGEVCKRMGGERKKKIEGRGCGRRRTTAVLVSVRNCVSFLIFV